MIGVEFQSAGRGTFEQKIAEAVISIFLFEFAHSKGRCTISPSNEVGEHPLLGAQVGGCYFFVAPAFASAAASAFALAAAACAGPRDAITVSRLKEAAFWRGGNLMKFAT